MSDQTSESPDCEIAIPAFEYSGAELAMLAELSAISGDDQATTFNQVRHHIERWLAAEPARREELKNSPLVQHWRKLDKERKANGYQSYNATRRQTYMLRVLYEEDRIVTRYVTGLPVPAKTARRNELQAKAKAKARANETPEQTAERKRRDAASKKAKRAANKNI